MRSVLRQLVLGLIVSGCGAAFATSPDSTLEHYLEAVEEQNSEAAYQLLARDTQVDVPREEFAAMMRENAPELVEQQAALATQLRDGSDARAEVRLASGETVVLTLQDGRWYLTGGILGAPTLSTPAAAVQAFRRALERRDLSGIWRVLGREARAELQADIDAVLADTEDEHDLEFDIRGDRARVRTSSGREIELVREAGEWHVADIF